MAYITNLQQGELITKVAAALDIPESVYEDATIKYADIGAWLAAEDSPLKEYLPEVFAQGSFRLGTVVRPVSEADEYDVDLVCRLQLRKDQTTQANLKKLVGDRLKQRDDLAQMLEESRRCWRLNYPDASSVPHFHLDILPSMGNPENFPTGILVTDTDLVRWQKSDPKAYANWFYGRMKAIFEATKSTLAESRGASIEEIPDWQVKTPLQTVVQLLKRHRDVFFEKDCDNKPVSIIITTLAALAYQGQDNNYAALADILRDMPRRIEKINDRYWVANPVETDENFADKWNEYPQRKRAFDRWLQAATTDFTSLAGQQPNYQIRGLLESKLGRGVATKALSGLPTITKVQPTVPGIGNTQHCQPPQWPMLGLYKAKVTGFVCNQFGKQLWGLSDRLVDKGYRLFFKVNTNAPGPYTVQWQVVNTGHEATRANDLRGDFYNSEADNRTGRWERTAYTGTHWVQAYVIKNGYCVAKSDRRLVRVN